VHQQSEADGPGPGELRVRRGVLPLRRGQLRLVPVRGHHDQPPRQRIDHEPERAAVLLPYVEQLAMYNATNFQQAASNLMNGNTGCCGPNDSQGKLAGSALVNTTVSTSTINNFSCPSDSWINQAKNSAYYSPTSTIRGILSNYNFIVYYDYTCNGWANTTQSPATYRTMFGENSNTTISMVTDGLSNTLALIEKTRDVYNGDGSPWFYRGWVQIGGDPSQGINLWVYNNTASTRKFGRLASWQNVGSLHPGGCNAARGDGSVVFIKETTDKVVLRRMQAMADGSIISSEN
jgi:hypothetical protein